VRRLCAGVIIGAALDYSAIDALCEGALNLARVS